MNEDNEIMNESDGTIESLIFTLLFFGHKYINLFNENIFNTYKNEFTFELIELITSRFNIIAISCTNATVEELKEIKHPTIINIGNHPNKKHKVTCFGYDRRDGFYIKDYRNGAYYVSEFALNSLWKDKECWVLIN